MALQLDTGTYVTAREAAVELGLTHGTFRNYRSNRGDSFLHGHELIRGRVFFKVEDVEALRKSGS